MYSLMQNMESLDESAVKIYTYQIVKALEFLHSRGIIHRDLKPDNILVAADGSLKLTDFGLSSVGLLDRRTSATQEDGEDVTFSKSLVGTPDYVAPEVILNLPHTYTADWWSLGVMVYEFLNSVPPFHEDTVMATFQHILTGEYEPLTPEDGVSPLCMDFISKLLVDDPTKRLGANGSQEVLNHPWLATIKGPEDVVAPFTPKLSDEVDTRYFEERYVPTTKDNADIYYDIKAAVALRRSKRKHDNRRLSCDVESQSYHSRRSILSTDDGCEGSDSGYSADDIHKFSCVAVAELVNENEKVSKRLRSLSGFMDSEDMRPVKERRSFLSLSRRMNKPLKGSQGSLLDVRKMDPDVDK